MHKALFRVLVATAMLLLTAVFVLCAVLLSYRGGAYYSALTPREHLFGVQSIDTMKYSRDVSGQILDDPDSFKPMLDKQMARIAEAGATHVGIATPYDARFLPVLRLWVASARVHGLSVWFRGNFSGWEGWFEYAKIDRDQHKQLLKDFLRNNPYLFMSGDIFTPCPECENGGPGDPRQTGDASGYNAFLIREKKLADDEFARQGKRVAVYPSMNADIAKQVITPATVRAFDGTILIDHYVRAPEQFASDIRAISEQLNASIGLGEFGAPIPDLNGNMTQARQAQYVDALFKAMYPESATIPVVNYWTLSGGSTMLLGDDGVPRAAYFTVQNYFKAFNVQGAIYNSIGESVSGVRINVDGSGYTATTDGVYQIFVPRQYASATLAADGYAPITLLMPANATTTLVKRDVYLEPLNPDLWYQMRAYFYQKLSPRID